MHIPEYFEFFNKTKMSSGKRALENIPFELKGMNAVKPLVITDSWTVKHGFVKVLKKSFYDSGMIIGAIYDHVHKYPSITTVMKLAMLYRDRGCDSIIALGGSSPATIAKGLNIVVSNRTDDLLAFEDMSKSVPLRPFIYIPTSDATGTEVSNEALIDTRLFKSFDLMPDIAVIDPRMIGKNDVKHIVNAGLMAIVQSIESCNISVTNVVNDSFAYASIALVYENMLAAMKRFGGGNNRRAFINGVVISGAVYSNSPEGLARAIGLEAEKRTGYPGGILAGIVLPYLLDYKLVNIQTGVRPELLLPLVGIDKYCSVPESERAAAGINALYDLVSRLDRVIPDNLKILNIPEYMLESIADAAEARTGNLFPAGTARKVLDHAYHGKKFSGGK